MLVLERRMFISQVSNPLMVAMKKKREKIRPKANRKEEIINIKAEKMKQDIEIIEKSIYKKDWLF